MAIITNASLPDRNELAKNTRLEQLDIWSNVSEVAAISAAIFKKRPRRIREKRAFYILELAVVHSFYLRPPCTQIDLLLVQSS